MQHDWAIILMLIVARRCGFPQGANAAPILLANDLQLH
jgi:hypothetical protein